jgi:two-component system sensor histidine kinase CpxA
MSAHPTARPRRYFPLYGKILLWFFANVLLVGGVAFWLVRDHFGLDRTLLLTRDGRARLQLRAEQTLDTFLAAGPGRAEADEVMARLGEDEQMRFALFDFGGTLVAGEAMTLPPLVRERLGTGRFRAGPPGRPGGGPPPENGAEGMRPPGPPGRPDPGGREDAAGDGRRGAGPGQAGVRRGRGWREGGRSADFPKEALRTENPTRYWVIARLPPTPEGPGGGRPLALVGMAESLGQSPLLFDPKPWLLGGLGLLAASALLWWPFVRGLTRSLAQMRGATERVAQGDFAVRVDDRRGDELGQLGTAINAMTGRLEGFVHGQKRFLGDIAHELCSPLARMEMALGILEHRTPPDLRERVGDVREEVREMSSLVDELLAFSKAGLQASATACERVALLPLLNAAVAREASGTQVTVAVPDDLAVFAAPALLSRAVGNILRNAVHHAGPSGPVAITATSGEAGAVSLTIADHGPGVPPEALPKLFDPFFRVDPSRTRETGGVGLGLAIVKSCVEACGGTVAARNRTDGTGLVVDLRLRAAP